jgi:hypothetical protein
VRYSLQPGDSYALFESGRLAMENNVLFPGHSPEPLFYAYSEYGEELADQNRVMADSMVAWKTDYSDPGISSSGGNFILLPPSTVFEDLAPHANPWFEQVTFKGAFGSSNWIEGWTLLFESGYVNN